MATDTAPAIAFDVFARPEAPQPRAPGPSELPALLGWLDTALRRGERGRLAREHPTVLDPMDPQAHRAVFQDARPVAHAACRLIEVRVGDVATRLGMISLVYTDPAVRGLGHGSACVEACVAELHRRGAELAVLWSDQPTFYARLGFHPAGTQRLHLLDRRSVLASEPDPAGLEMASPRSDDWPILEALYAGRRVHAVRAPGDLERLARAPDCSLLVARRRGRPEAYAACGRGDDFRDVVHEWAGEPEAVLALLRHFVRRRSRIAWMTGPTLEAPEARIRAAGVVTRTDPFGLVRLLDPGLLWQRLAADDPGRRGTRLEARGAGFRFEGPAGSVELDGRSAVELLLGPPASGSCPRDAGPGASFGRPWPLFVWGFDSF